MIDQDRIEEQLRSWADQLVDRSRQACDPPARSSRWMAGLAAAGAVAAGCVALVVLTNRPPSEKGSLVDADTSVPAAESQGISPPESDGRESPTTRPVDAVYLGVYTLGDVSVKSVEASANSPVLRVRFVGEPDYESGDSCSGYYETNVRETRERITITLELFAPPGATAGQLCRLVSGTHEMTIELAEPVGRRTVEFGGVVLDIP